MESIYIYIAAATALLTGFVSSRIYFKNQSLNKLGDQLSNLSDYVTVLETRQRKVVAIVAKIRAILAAHFIAFAVLVYYGATYYLMTLLISTIIVIIILLLCRYKISSYDASLLRLKEQIKKQKEDLIKQIGPDMIDVIRGNDACDEKWAGEKKNLHMDLVRHKVLIGSLFDFKWCPQCSQGKECSFQCGAKYWDHIRKSLAVFKSSLN